MSKSEVAEGIRQLRLRVFGDGGEIKMIYMVVEHFRGGDAAPVYQRLREHGRMAPEGLAYVSSWVDSKMELCFQVMQTADRALLDEWISNWRDIVEFEVYPVMTSAEAQERIASRLRGSSGV